MLSAAGLELTSLVNSGSAWKVSKGNRSSSRRARRTVGKVSKSSDLVHANSGSFNMPISESEKHRGNVLSCRFSDKAEHVPIKKRRFFFRSPSPPPKIPSPDSEEIAIPSNTQDDALKSAVICPVSPKAELGKMSEDETDVHINYPKKVNEALESNEDFSGISILAAAACSSSLGREFGYAEDGSGVEEPSVHEGPVEVSTNSEAQSLSKGLREDFVNTSDISIGGTSSCVTTALVGELAATSTAECASEKPKDVEKSIREPSFGDGTPTVSSDIFPGRKHEDMAGSWKPQSRDDRLHWDLNVVMDAWEQPFGYQDAHTSDCISQGSEVAIRCDTKRSSEAFDLLKEPVNSESDDKKKLVSCEPRILVDQIPHGNTKNQVIDNCSHKNQPVSMCHMSISSDCKNVRSSLVDNSDPVRPFLSSYADEKPPFLKPLNIKRHADNKPTVERVNSDMAAPTDHKNLSGPSVPGTNCTVISVGAATKNTSVSAVDTQARLTGIPTPVIDNKDTPSSMLSDKPFDDEKHCLKDDMNDAQIYMASQVNNYVPMEKVEEEIDDPQRSSSMHEFTATSDTNVSEPVETDVQEVSIMEVTVASAEHLEQKFISDAPCDPSSVQGTEAAGNLQEDYDSQYEDGELREPKEHVWEEYDAVEGEAKHINYGFSRNIYGVSAVDHHASESGQVMTPKHKDAGSANIISSVSGLGNEHCPEPDRPITDSKDEERDDNLLKSIHSRDEKMKGSASDELLESNNISSANARAGDESDTKGRIYHHATRSTDSDTDSRTGSRLYRRKLLSRVERSISRHMSFGEDQAGNRSKFDGVSARWERGSSYVKSSERVRYSMQSQLRVQQVNSWDGSSVGCRGIKRNYSPTYRQQVKPNEDDTTEKEDRDGTVNAVSYLNQPSTNDVSVADGDVAGSYQSGHQLDGDLGFDRLTSRGRFLRYGPQMNHRAGRGRYHGPSPDDTFQTSLKYRHPLPRRDRSVSPNERRLYPFVDQSHARSPSRSRTRSPNPKHSPRGRSGAADCGGVYLRHTSRSPNFRPEPRILRMRSPPHKQPGFGADHMTGFRPFRKDQGSPPSRWVTSRKGDLGHFCYKQRPLLDRSPGRISLRGYRADLLDSARNPKPDVNYRPNTGRFSEMNVTGRALRLENYENRKRQFGPIHLAKRGYEDGIAKRLRRDDDGDFVSTNRELAEFHGRGIRVLDNRNEDMSRRFRGDASFMYDRGGKFSSNSKPCGFDGMDSSRNLKSAESYRSINPGRFNEMDGAGRGRRYEDSYDDRRRHYGAVHLRRHNEMEGVRGRLSHDVDDNLPVIQSSCNDDATDCRGRNARGLDDRLGDLPRRQREEQQFDLSGQEKKQSETPELTDVQVPAENETAEGNSPS